LSWFAPSLVVSRRLIDTYAPRHESFVDVGAGASSLAGDLQRSGWTDLTLVDIAPNALEVALSYAEDPSALQTVVTDVREWEPSRTFATWHDRAVFHFLTADEDVSRYAQLVRTHLEPGGVFLLGTFALGGPEMCSGLPVRQWGVAEASDLFSDVGPLLHDESERHVTPAGGDQRFQWFVFRRS
jgi:SAM-dependent methyltransferase